MKTNEKPKYGILNNVLFMTKLAWQTHKRVIFLCLAIAAAQVGLNLAQLYVTPQILAQVEKGASVLELLLTIGLFSGLLFLMTGLSSYLRENRLPGEVDTRSALIRMMVHKACCTSYPNTRDPKFQKMKVQAENATNSNAAPGEHIWTTLTQLLTNVAGFCVYLLLLSGQNLPLIGVVVVTSALGFFVSRYIHEWEYRHREEKEQCEKELSYFLAKPRSLEFAKDVRIFGLGTWLRELQAKALKTLSAFLVRREKVYVWANVLDVAMTLLRNGIAYAVLIWKVLDQGLPASEFLLYFTAISGFSDWVTGILSEFSQLHRESIALSQIQEYLHFPEPFLLEGGAQPPKADAYQLTLENVTFRYPGTQKNILENVNLTIHPGEKLAIVGLNGAGKTTLVKLLCGFYDPCEGRVLLNGQDIRTFNRPQYYELFSAVFQKYLVLDTTIAQCVAQSVDNIDLDRVNTCLEQAGLTEVVAKYPQGLDTHIGREVYLDGVLLSGGQTQRLMLARALYKDGPILVLDEPTAALDPIAENDIYQKYSDMTAGKTSVFISHRLASTRFCDRIIFVADGRIVEEGTHQSLLEKQGAYAQLFEVQSRYYREGGDPHEEN